jgi:hypothetical protein
MLCYLQQSGDDMMARCQSIKQRSTVFSMISKEWPFGFYNTSLITMKRSKFLAEV